MLRRAIFLIVFCSTFFGIVLHSQDSFNEVYKIDEFSITPNGLLVLEDRIIASYKYVDPESLSIVTEIFERKLDDNRRLQFEDFTSSRTGLISSNNEILLMKESDFNTNLTSGFKVLNLNLDEIHEIEFALSTQEGGNVRSVYNQANLFLANALFIDDDNHDINIIKFNEAKEVEWSIDIGDNDQIMFPWELKLCANQDLLLSTKTVFAGSNISYGQLYRIDPMGNILWIYTSKESTTHGNAPFYCVTLSNGNFVQSAEVDMLVFGQYRFPPLLSWVDSNGEFLKDTSFITTPGNHVLTIRGLKEGKGDYFFVFGTEESGGENSIKYGWIMKMANDGKIIWNKNYRHPEFDVGRFHHIKNLIELDNGEIVTSGGIRDENEQMRLWLMKLNSMGCLNDGPCDEIVTHIEDHAQFNFKTKIYPNPTSDKIVLELSNDSYKYKIIDNLGISYKLMFHNHNVLDIHHLPAGLFNLVIYRKGKLFETIKFVKI